MQTAAIRILPDGQYDKSGLASGRTEKRPIPAVQVAVLIS